ncbi:LysR family transcriptional regulator [Advenella mimigardefordensis]|uniref:Transcriptional regulator, LysR family n=1 Tax=Advenella mimigardefordensis (strain DSM 17166 / LMG 22922 / DPN7) TaxID=1247726 RepID=W0PEA5_ADVMD|nr:LysR family transcriptional regulator [Advenella mimigardefordensis]AHG65214.1 transcriptional regulator, LysR family [Advenella mimigardefordensis DPN7]
MNKPLAPISDFDLRLIRVFRTVAECGSFTAAESTLGITRSAISLHMSDLEQRLGMRLCQRGRAGFALTDEGREVLRASESMMASIEDFRREVNQLHDSLRGELNIGLMNNLVTQPRMRITHALAKVRQQSQEVRINISMSPPGDIERRLLDGHLHMGAFPLINKLSGLEYHTLYDEKSQLYCSHTHPLFAKAQKLSIKDLQGIPAVIPGYRLSPEAIALHQPLADAARASDREGIAFLVLTGQYVGFLPDHYAKTWVEKNMMTAFAPEHIHYSVSIAAVTRKNRRQNLIIDRVLAELMQEE